MFDAVDDADEIKRAGRARFFPGATSSRLYDKHDPFFCELSIPHG